MNAVRRPGSGPSAGQVRDWCAAALAGFKVPVTVEFRYSLPYTRTGKLLKQELEREERSRAQAPRGPAPAGHNPSVTITGMKVIPDSPKADG